MEAVGEKQDVAYMKTSANDLPAVSSKRTGDVMGVHVRPW